MSDVSPQVIVIAGPNGAGKTTLAPFLLRDTFGLLEYVNADSIATGLSAFSPESASVKAGRIMLRRLHELADRRSNFAFETTLSTRSYAPWLDRLRRRGYNVHLLFLWLRSPDLATQRVRERVVAGGHNVPEYIIRRRYSKGVSNFFNLYSVLADSWVVYDNSVSGRTPRIARGEGKTNTKVFDTGLWQQFKGNVK
ncbi:MAG TPA: zeta toxin family protein [Pyrinomonadaceae bacterium]|nr:zeta toxin family protein [Pyrinomonadaceae bacterium]